MMDLIYFVYFEFRFVFIILRSVISFKFVVVVSFLVSFRLVFVRVLTLFFFFVLRRECPVQRSCWVPHGPAVESAQQPVQSQTQLYYTSFRSVSE